MQMLSSCRKTNAMEEQGCFHLCISRCRNGERGPVALGCMGDSAAVAHLLTPNGTPSGVRRHSLSHLKGVCAQKTPLEGSPGNISFQPQERSNQTLRNAAQRNPKGQKSKVLEGTWQVRGNLGNVGLPGTLGPIDPTKGSSNPHTYTLLV